MDLSTYYEELQVNFKMLVFAECLVFFVMIFIGVRSIRDKKEKIWQKMVSLVGLTVILVFLIMNVFIPANLARKDVELKTIYGYEGYFEIVETTHGIYNRALFLIDGKEINLKYFADEGYDFDIIKPGEYTGKIVYAQQLAEIMFLEIYPLE